MNSDLNNILDGGQTNALLKQIRQGNNSTESVLNKLKDIESIRNLVSADVIRELMYSSEGQISPSLIQLIVENPSILKDPAISDRVNSLIDYKTLKQTNSNRNQLEESLAELYREKFALIREATKSIFEDKMISSSDQMEQYRNIQIARQDMFGCIQIIESYVYDSNLQAADSFVKNINKDSNSIRKFDYEDLNDYMEILSMIDKAARENRPPSLLSKTELNKLFDLSKKPSNFASRKAKTILKYFHNDIYERSLAIK